MPEDLHTFSRFTEQRGHQSSLYKAAKKLLAVIVQVVRPIV